MRLSTYREEKADWPTFVSFWSAIYKAEDEDPERPDSEFLQHLQWPDGKLAAKDVDFLFEWKNGMELAKNKKIAPTRMKSRLRAFNSLRGSEYGKLWPLAQDCTGGPVWGRFVCHIVSPERCPIWDKNVLRAFQLIMNLREDPQEIWEDETYRGYAGFFENAKVQVRARIGCPSFRRLDQALFAFGNHYLPVPETDGYESVGRGRD